MLNSTARLVSLSRKADHITPLLIDLHWLPVEQRINFKVLLFTYKIVNGLAPSYLNDLLFPYVPRRALTVDLQTSCFFVNHHIALSRMGLERSLFAPPVMEQTADGH